MLYGSSLPKKITCTEMSSLMASLRQPELWELGSRSTKLTSRSSSMEDWA